MKRVVKTILSPDGTRKVEIYRRGDGSFGFAVSKFDDRPDKQCWIKIHRYPRCWAESEDAAEAEARKQVSWAAEAE